MERLLDKKPMQVFLVFWTHETALLISIWRNIKWFTSTNRNDGNEMKHHILYISPQDDAVLFLFCDSVLDLAKL